VTSNSLGSSSNISIFPKDFVLKICICWNSDRPSKHTSSTSYSISLSSVNQSESSLALTGRFGVRLGFTRCGKVDIKGHATKDSRKCLDVFGFIEISNHRPIGFKNFAVLPTNQKMEDVAQVEMKEYNLPHK